MTAVLDSVSADEVLASHFTLVDRPGEIETVTLDGVQGWTSPNPHPVLSLMRWVTADQDRATEALEAVIARFSAEGRGFDWMTGPNEADLVPLLYERGFVKPALDVAAMVRPLGGDVAPPVLDGLHIWKVEDPQDARIYSVMAKGFDVSPEVGAIYHRAYVTPSDVQRSDVYAVSEMGRRDPVAVGYLSYIGDGPSALLRVSSTLSSHRGRGIYHALVKHRLRVAQAAGRHQAFVHAYSPASRKALENLGFESAGQLQLHRWRP
jgi:RimJ/RimL family protein N-acetyltransferase